MEQDRKGDITGLSEVEQLRRQASEAVIEANVDPTRLSSEEHLRVRSLQSLASLAVMEANATVFRGSVE